MCIQIRFCHQYWDLYLCIYNNRAFDLWPPLKGRIEDIFTYNQVHLILI